MTDIVNLTKQRPPALFWRKIKEQILGKKYSLSLVFAGSALMKKLNTNYRRKNKIADTLSFALSKNDGEILLNINQSKENLLRCYIHSLLHLKGSNHNNKMRQMERQYFNKFSKNIKPETYVA